MGLNDANEIFIVNLSTSAVIIADFKPATIRHKQTPINLVKSGGWVGRGSNLFSLEVVDNHVHLLVEIRQLFFHGTHVLGFSCRLGINLYVY